MKKIGLLFLSLGLFSIAISSCKEKIPAVSERIKKAWTPTSVKEGSTVVYTKGGTGNIRAGYSGFSLNLASAPNSTLKEFDNNTFNGTYEVSADGLKLTLKGLNPQPTGTSGTIEYTIVSLNNEGTELKLARTTASQKTNNTVNEYTLVSQ